MRLNIDQFWTKGYAEHWYVRVGLVLLRVSMYTSKILVAMLKE